MEITINHRKLLEISTKMKTITVTTAILLLTACAPHNDSQHAVGMANPASVCCEKICGELDIVKAPVGE